MIPWLDAILFDPVHCKFILIFLNIVKNHINYYGIGVVLIIPSEIK